MISACAYNSNNPVTGVLGSSMDWMGGATTATAAAAAQHSLATSIH